MRTEPYFMSNTDWFYYDEEAFCYKLTDKATRKAKDSYEEFYVTKEVWDEDGELMIIV